MNNIEKIIGKVYLASDFHLGIFDREENEQRENMILHWLDHIKTDATHLFLLGDVFDFWFEYKDVVPKGYFRLLAKLYELKQQNINIYYFTGNHDMWIENYFSQYLGITVFKTEKYFIINGKKYLIGHGDGVGKNELSYKLLKWIFRKRFSIFLYRMLHPRWAFVLAHYCSQQSRKKSKLNRALMPVFKEKTLQDHCTIIYGHYHHPSMEQISDNILYMNTGDWIEHFSYIKIEKEQAKLIYFKNVLA